MNPATQHQILRDWNTKAALDWSDNGAGYWRAYWNHLEIGGYSAEPSPHWEGCYVTFGNTKFTTVIRTAEEARAAIEAKFQEWLALAFACRPQAPDGNAGLRAAIDGCGWCAGRSFSFAKDGTKLDCIHCRPYRKLLEADEPRFYIRDMRGAGAVGNCALWWRAGSQGYACDLAEAGLYTKAEANEITKGNTRPEHRAYPAEIVRRLGVTHVRAEALAALTLDAEAHAATSP